MIYLVSITANVDNDQLNQENAAVTTTNFNESAHCNLSNVYFNLESVNNIINMVELASRSEVLKKVNELIELERNKALLLLDDIDNTDSCNNDNINLLLIFKIVSVAIAVFLFFELDTTREFPVKMFKLAFTVVFSEIYILYQFIKLALGEYFSHIM